MAGSGPAPKPDAQRRRRNSPTHGPERPIVPDGRVRGPRPDPAWSENVRAWYETWRRAPQAALFEATDWSRLRMLAPLVEKAFAGSAAAMTEVRLSESLLGATVTDRLKARLRIERPVVDEAAGDAQVVSLSSRRADAARRLQESE